MPKPKTETREKKPGRRVKLPDPAYAVFMKRSELGALETALGIVDDLKWLEARWGKNVWKDLGKRVAAAVPATGLPAVNQSKRKPETKRKGKSQHGMES